MAGDLATEPSPASWVDVVTGAPPPLSCSPAFVMQKRPIGLNWTENADNADAAEIAEVTYCL